MHPLPAWPAEATLLLIDLQEAIDHPKWAVDGPRNNPDAEATVARLLAHWREHGRPIIHIRHDSREAASPYRPGQPGNRFKPAATPRDGETVIGKGTTNAFIGTGLEARLRAARCPALVVAGVITNNSVESTVRMAGDLGFAAYLVADGCFTFAGRDGRGVLHDAETLHAISLANLDGEFCRVVSAAQVLAADR